MENQNPFQPPPSVTQPEPEQTRESNWDKAAVMLIAIFAGASFLLLVATLVSISFFGNPPAPGAAALGILIPIIGMVVGFHGYRLGMGAVTGILLGIAAAFLMAPLVLVPAIAFPLLAIFAVLLAIGMVVFACLFSE